MNRFPELQIFDETLEILHKGSYCVQDGGALKKVSLCYSKEERERALAILPDEVHRISDAKGENVIFNEKECKVSVHNMDSYECAWKQYQECEDSIGNGEKIMVLNFANPVNPGGGVRRGARAQEEDLCRKSSLLPSLESKAAECYYDYNRNLRSYLGSDGMILSPNVEVFRGSDNKLLESPFPVSVLTCAAPLVSQGLEGLTQNEYQELLYNRIDGMIKVAIHFNYRYLVLGAWGCGAFGNDPKLIANLFYQVLFEEKIGSHVVKDFFNRIEFAVFDRTSDLYNWKTFVEKLGENQHFSV